MMKIVIIVSILSVVCGIQHGYINNNLVEIDDPILLPYPYQDPNFLSMEQGPVGFRNAMGTIVVPAPIQSQEIMQSPLSLLYSLVSSAIGYLKRSIMYMITSIATLIFGCFSFFGICKLTSLCNYSNVESFLTGPGLSYFITTDRFKRAADFVETAISKYRLLQNLSQTISLDEK